jgi:predicted nuclease with TOPRIM domain
MESASVMEYEELGRLEKIIEKLLAEFAGIKHENERLQADLARKDQEINELREMATLIKEEKNEINERVNSLINSLEKWEESQAHFSKTVEQAEAAGQQDLRYPNSLVGTGVETCE